MRLRSWLPFIVLGCLTTSVWAVYEGSWDYSWDFNDGLQGWALGGAGGAWQTDGTVYLPNASFATLPAPVPLGGNLGQTRFILQADVFVGAANYLQDTGVAAVRTGDLKGPWVAGTSPGSQGAYVRNNSWDGVTTRKSWGLSVGYWTTFQLDYGFTSPGYYFGYYTATPGNAGSYPDYSWLAINTTGRYAHPTDLLSILRIGAVPSAYAGGPWSEARFDNVRLALIPEPATAVFALCGAVILCSRSRHGRWGRR